MNIIALFKNLCFLFLHATNSSTWSTGSLDLGPGKVWEKDKQKAGKEAQAKRTLEKQLGASGRLEVFCQSLCCPLPTECYLVFGGSDIHILQSLISLEISECTMSLLYHTQTCGFQGLPCVHWQSHSD